MPRLTLIVLSLLCAASARGEGVGHRKSAHEPKSVPVDPAADKPMVHKVFDISQRDQKFVRLFAPSGRSEVCGPATLTNAMLYLKLLHQPPFPKLLEKEFKDKSARSLSGRAKASQQRHAQDRFDEIDVVFDLFKRCHTDRSEGTSSEQLRHCAEKVIKDSGLGVIDAFVIGAGARPTLKGKKKPNPFYRAPTMADVRRYAHNTWAQGAPVERSDWGIVLLFAFYDPQTWQRHGGHFVALAGDDANDPSLIYVANPLVNYDPANDGGNGETVSAELAAGKASRVVASAPGDFYSKVALEKLPEGAHGGDLPPFTEQLQTKDLTARPDRVALLEDMILFLPRLKK